jgi:hypothetical protein
MGKQIHRMYLIFFTQALLSCAYIYQVQLGEIDNRDVFEKTKFEIKLSELGVNIDEAGALIGAVAKIDKDKSNKASGIIKLFQFGPSTGNPVFSDKYTENILSLLREKCPQGRVSGLVSIREMNKYPVVSGEIVKVTGYCLTKKDRT